VLKVLIAEDDLVIADLADEILVEVCGIVPTVAGAVALAQRHKPDLAVLVLDLRFADGGLGTEIAAQLLPLGSLGVLYATGNISQVVLTTADGDACLSKPYSSADLKVGKLLRQQAAIARFGSFALRESDLLKVLTEAARVCAEGLNVPVSKVCRYRTAENDLLIEAGHGSKTVDIGQ
jgi:CheY-like chemotaxis protein